MQGPVPHGGVYDYGVQGGHVSDHPASSPISTPVSGHAPSPSPTPAMAQITFSAGLWHGYDEPKCDNHVPMQHPYGHGSSQPVYPQASNQPGYRAQQQYGKQPSYGMPLQGPPPQSYGPTRPSQPGDMPYQGPIQSNQSYGPNVPPQQQYPYASSGQSYPSNGSASGAEGTIKQCLLLAPAIHSKVASQFHVIVSLVDNSQLAMCKVQPVVMDYTHLHNNVIQNNAGYGYQGSQDPAYGSGLGQPIVHHQVASRLMLSQQQLNQVMISRFLSQVHMELLQEVHQLGMGKTLSP
ncbi:hypothetical protein GH714_012898 [Hevea brasiliensis]|uniref:Uncharacterized protein n=1 Tax=Hevea brasiliensis TaxID=3981 RepID=A0A6A6KQQ6_HEVBR|nr:hypothetical protein GH714_012898 [Hevea brasiliensis]